MSEVGKFYAPADYAGFLRRFAAFAIDLGVVFAANIAVKAVGLTEQPEFWFWVVFSFVYFVVLESTLGTLGYLLTGVKIVTIKGERPSLPRMTFRLLVWIARPIHPFIDFYWLGGDDYKQTLRDKFAGTLVIRKKAVPAGEGEVRLNRYQFLGMSFVFYEVKKPLT